MAAVTHAHYIRTIHTSFTASASASSQYLNQVHYQHSPTTNTNISTNTPTNTPRHPPYAQSISTHNTHMYTHHLRDLAPHRHNHPSKQDSFSLAAQQQQQQQQQGQQGQQQVHEPPRTRRRSLSIRMPPTASPYPSAHTHKFDPFADEPITPVLALPSSSPPSPPLSQAQAQTHAQGMRRVHEAPYTIQIPAAQQADIQLYTSSSSPPQAQAQYQAPQISIPIPRTPRLAAASLPPPAAATKQSRPLSPRAPTFTPRSSSVSPPPSLPSAPSNSNSLNANTATPTHNQTQTHPQNHPQTHPPTQKHTNPNPNLSKVVASILLNRVTAGARHRGGPTGLMRRRALVGGLREGRGQGGEVYVKSCLSSVVFVEA